MVAPLTRRLLFAALAGLSLCLVFVLYSVFIWPIQSGRAQSTATITAVHKQPPASPGLPVRLKIPKIGVDAALDYVGLTSEGNLGVPVGSVNAAWYKLGPRPGEKGDAVIDGHYGWVNNIPAVFDNLHTLQPGDNLYVEDAKGKTVTFVVRELRMYDPNQNDTDVFVSTDGKAHLNLITCQGVWNKTLNGYPNRLVVFADEGAK